jgi:Flp pilus assembly protein TadG
MSLVEDFMSLVERMNREGRAGSGGTDEPDLFPRQRISEPRKADDRQCMGPGLVHDRNGQSLLEAALLLPLLLTILVNAVSLGYFFSVYLNLATAPRQGAEYSIQGTSSALQVAVPSAASISSLVYENIAGAIPAAANTPTRVCTVALGLSGSGSNQVPNCETFGTGSATFPDLQPDPEAPYLLLNRVDIQYTVTPLFQGSIFNIVPNSLTLHRSVVMRAMP